MNEQINLHTEIINFCSNFTFTYYPSQAYLEDIIEIVSEVDRVNLNTYLMDLEPFMYTLSNNIRFNRSFMEVLFMFILNDEFDIDKDYEAVFEEFHCGVYESIVGSEIFNKNINYINLDTIKDIRNKVYKYIKKKDLDIVVLGWHGSRYGLGVMYV